MKRFQRITLLTLALGFCAVTLSFLPGHTVVAAPAPPPSVPVTVVNTPLPVSGTVNATVADPAASRVQFTANSVVFPFTAGVPAGQALVIEELSVVCIGAPVTDVRLFVTSGGSLAQYTFAPVSLTASEWISTQTSRIYADPSTVVSVGTGTSVAGANCTVSIAGHLANP